jgi:hypothetical protein
VTGAVLLALCCASGLARPAVEPLHFRYRDAGRDAASAPEFGDSFWKQWGDGRAELAGYDLVTPRYGAPRRGTAVAIFVTETFSNSLRVKSDPGKHPASDEFPVMKLNLVQDFATGIYDYNLQTSAFVALSPVNGRPAGAPTKVSFSSQEWCGNVYTQLLFDMNAARLTSHSYFDGEADRDTELTCGADVADEDALLLWARGLAWPRVGPGEGVRAPVMQSLRQSRLLHQPVRASVAEFMRPMVPQSVTVPAGTFDAEVATVRIENGRAWTFWIERAEPRRVLQWETSDGEKAQLLASDRLAYWQLNGPGGEAALAKLGLTPRAPRMP